MVKAAGMCCKSNPCCLEWERPCDAHGGCLDRSTCGDCAMPVVKDYSQTRHDAAAVAPPAVITLNLAECECCGAPNRVLHRCVVYGIEASACAICRGDALSDDIDDLRDEIDRVYREQPDDHRYGIQLQAAIIEALSSAICRAVAPMVAAMRGAA